MLLVLLLLLASATQASAQTAENVLVVINAAGAIGTATIETGAGPMVGYGVALFYAWQAYKLYEEISNLFGNADDIINALAGAVGSIQARLAIHEPGEWR